MGRKVHTKKTFWNLVNSYPNQVVVTIFRLIWIQTGVCLDANQSENGNYNLISVRINKIPKSFLSVYAAVMNHKFAVFFAYILLKILHLIPACNESRKNARKMP